MLVTICATILGLIIVWRCITHMSVPDEIFAATLAGIAYVQLIVAPLLFYRLFQENQIARTWNLCMPINEEEYFSVLFPLTIAFIVGLMFKKTQRPFQFRLNLINRKTCLRITIFGLCFAGIGLSNLPTYMEFLVFMGTQLSKCGLLMLHFTRAKKQQSTPWIPSIFSFTFFGILGWEVIHSGMFANSIFWTLAFIFFKQSFSPNRSFKNLALTLIGFLGIFVLQSVKTEYRAKAWGNSESGIAAFTESIIDTYQKASNISDNSDMLFFSVDRMNQGRLVAHVIASKHHVNHEPRVINAILAAAIPRFLWPEKPKAGGHENIIQFTGLQLVGSTSMNISPFSDFILDYGTTNAIFASLIFGLFIKVVFSFVLRHRNPYVPFLSPILIMGLFTIESDLAAIINHAVKGVFFLFCLTIILKTEECSNRVDEATHLLR